MSVWHTSRNLSPFENSVKYLGIVQVVCKCQQFGDLLLYHEMIGSSGPHHYKDMKHVYKVNLDKRAPPCLLRKSLFYTAKVSGKHLTCLNLTM